MKYIKFTMNRGKDFSFSEIQARRILKYEKQLVPIFDENNEWTGETINQGHIISTDRDFPREIFEAEEARRNVIKLNEPKPTAKQIKASEDAKKKIRDKFKIKK